MEPRWLQDDGQDDEDSYNRRVYMLGWANSHPLIIIHLPFSFLQKSFAVKLVTNSLKSETYANY